jgi:hypothetical protein
LLQLTAPCRGVISSQPAPVGTFLLRSQPFVQMYDPVVLTLETPVPVADLSRLAVGMVATLHVDGAPTIHAEVQQVLPRTVQPDSSGSPPPTQDELLLVMRPKRVADVARLVPGLQFTGTIDTRSPPPGPGNRLTVNH